MSNNFYIGTAPFCDPRGAQCEVTPGFEDSGKDKCGDGACCWSGNKIKCSFNNDKWEKTNMYKELVNQDPKLKGIAPSFTWYGKAPFCGATTCDVFKGGMLPVKNHNCGDGSCCLWGEKWLGIKPLTDNQRELVKTGQKECMEFKKLQEKTLQAGLKFGGDIAGALAKI